MSIAVRLTLLHVTRSPKLSSLMFAYSKTGGGNGLGMKIVAFSYFIYQAVGSTPFEITCQSGEKPPHGMKHIIGVSGPFQYNIMHRYKTQCIAEMCQTI